MLAGYKSTAGMETESTNPVRDRTERKMILYCVMFEGNYCNFMTDHFHEIQRILKNLYDGTQIKGNKYTFGLPKKNIIEGLL